MLPALPGIVGSLRSAGSTHPDLATTMGYTHLLYDDLLARVEDGEAGAQGSRERVMCPNAVSNSGPLLEAV